VLCAGKPSKADAISPGQQAAATGLAETAADAGTAAVGACIPSDAAEAAKQKAATAAAKAASGKPGSVVVIPGARSNFLAQAGISDEAEEDWQQFCQQGESLELVLSTSSSSPMPRVVKPDLTGSCQCAGPQMPQRPRQLCIIVQFQHTS
jgi:hypothetical protein